MEFPALTASEADIFSAFSTASEASEVSEAVAAAFSTFSAPSAADMLSVTFYYRQPLYSPTLPKSFCTSLFEPTINMNNTVAIAEA